MEASELKKMIIPMGNTREDCLARRKIIWNFYEEWKKQNPLQKKYNIALKAYINIRYVSIDETSYQASKSFLSTLAVLDEARIAWNRRSEVIGRNCASHKRKGSVLHYCDPVIKKAPFGAFFCRRKREVSRI